MSPHIDFWITALHEIQQDDTSDSKSSYSQQLVDIPGHLRGACWKIIAGSGLKASQYPDHYFSVTLLERVRVDRNPDIEGEIRRDMNRTFPHHKFFRDRNSLGQDELFTLLRGYSIHHREVGYCQGMGFIGAMLLTYMSLEDSFWMLVTLMDDYGMAGLYKPGLPMLEVYLSQLNETVRRELPELHSHFQSHGIELSMFASQWLMTIFIVNFEFENSSKIFHLLILNNYKIILKISIKLLKLNLKNLLNLKLFENILNYLNSIKFSPDILTD
jgi:hypothetical protein